MRHFWTPDDGDPSLCSIGLGRMGLGIGAGGGPSRLVGPDIFASATGTGSGSTADNPTSLSDAQTRARAWIADGNPTATVKLRDTGGVYRIATALAFDASDSGTTYEAYSGEEPTISGGVVVTGFVDQGSNVWKAALPPGLTAPYPQELYVGGRRAMRARGSHTPAGWTKKTIAGGAAYNGFEAPDSTIAGYTYPTSGTLVGSRSWKRMRVGIASAVGQAITARASDWAASQDEPTVDLDTIDWIEGWRELVSGGEGYFAVDADGVWYRPRPGENMASVEVVLPVLERLVTVEGSLAVPDIDVTFSGIEFAHATWHQPYQTVAQNADACGFSSLQSIIHGIRPGYQKMPGAILVRSAHGVVFDECRVSHVAQVGIAFEYGAQDGAVTGTIFEEVGGAPVTIGDAIHTIEDPHPTDVRQKLSGISVTNCVAVDCAWLYDCCEAGVFTAYTDGCTISHNVFEFGRWNLISSGMGWGLSDSGGTRWPVTGAAWGSDSVNAANVIEDNLLRGATTVLLDSGAIYLNGAQAATSVSRNWISDARYYGIYVDNGATEAVLDDNAVETTGQTKAIYCQDAFGIFATDNDITDTHINTALGATTIDSGDVSNTESGTDSAATWSAAGLAVVMGAGLEPAYAHLRRPNVARVETATAMASSYETTGALVPRRVIDGSTATHWRSAAADTLPWILVDLGTPHDVDEVVAVPRVDDMTAAWRRSFKIQGATSFSGPWTDLYEHGTTPIWKGELARVRGVDASYRYIRVLKTAAEALSLTAICVYGKPTDAALLWAYDWSDLPTGDLGAAYTPSAGLATRTGAGGGLNFELRATTAIVRTGAATAASVAANNPAIAKYGSAQGLSFYGATVMRIGTRNPDSFAGGGSGFTPTANYAASPLGPVESMRLQVTSGGFSKFASFATTVSQKLTASFWVKDAATPGGIYNTHVGNGVLLDNMTGNTTAAWQYVRRVYTAATTTTSIITEDGRAGNGGVPAAGARDVVQDLIQIVDGVDSGPFTTANRAAEGLYHSEVTFIRASGRLKLEVELSAVGLASADMSAAWRLWTDRDDATTYVEIGTNRVVTCVVGGSSVALPTAIPVWAEFAAWKLRVDVGNGAPTGSATIDGVTTSLGTGAGSHAALATRNADIGCSGTTKHIPGIWKAARAYA